MEHTTHMPVLSSLVSLRALAWLFFRTKRLTGRLPRGLRWLLMPPLRWLSGRQGAGRT